MGSNERIPGYVVSDAVCYASAMHPLHATIEKFAADGYTHVDCSSMPHDEVEAALGLTIAQLSALLRCAEGGASP